MKLTNGAAHLACKAINFFNFNTESRKKILNSFSFKIDLWRVFFEGK